MTIIKHNKIIVGVNWGAVPEDGWFGAKELRGVDLDLNCIELTGDGIVVSNLSQENKETIWGCISKDDMEGDMNGNDQLDNEWLELKLSKIPEGNQLLLTVSNYIESNLEKISHLDYRIYSGESNNVRDRFYYFDLKEYGLVNNPMGIFLGILKKTNGQWHFEEVNGMLTTCDYDGQFDEISDKFL